MNGERGAKGGRNDRKRALKIKLIYLKKLKKLNANRLLNKFKNIKILNFRIVDSFIKVRKIKSNEKSHPIFDSFIMLSSIISMAAPETKEETKNEQKLEKVEEKEIVRAYKNELEELRDDLNELSVSEKVIKEEKEKEKLEEITDKVTTLIDKLDTLEDKTTIEVEDIKKLPPEDIALLVGAYMTSFDKKEKEPDIKSSDLYIDISDKVQELKKIDKVFTEKVEEERKEKHIDKKELDTMKEKYYEAEDNNKDIDNFTKEVSSTLRDYEVKLDKLRDANNKATLKLKTSKKITTLLLGLIVSGLVLPLQPKTKKMIIATGITILVLKHLLHPSDRKNNIVSEIIDYSHEINDEITSIDATIDRLNISIDELDDIEADLKSKYSDYSEAAEYKELMNNIEKIKAKLKEKLEVLKENKKKAEDELNKNKARVKML